MRRIFFSIITLIWFGPVFGQPDTFDEKSFFENLKTSYYSLQSTETENISVLLTNMITETFASKEWKNPEIFPLQLIWFTPDRLFLSQQGVPSLPDTSKEQYSYLVERLKSQITDVLFDLQRFYFSDIYSTISDNYTIVSKQDVVKVSFNAVEDSDTTFFEYYFGLNGLCLRILSHTPSNNIKVETTPYFDTIKTKWIIGGWEVKIYSEEEIKSGYLVELKFREKNSIWIPADLILTVQRKSAPGKTFNEVLKFRNLLFNQSLHYIEQ